MATLALPLMPVGARIVFITSHQAHFHGRGGQLPRGYEPVAASKRAGGPLPTLDQFADGVAGSIDAAVPSGHTTYVGGHDYLTYEV